jgi:TM2 domain-containing membrane protein YozV
MPAMTKPSFKAASSACIPIPEQPVTASPPLPPPAQAASSPAPRPPDAFESARDPHAFLEPTGSDAPQSSATKPCPFCGETIRVVARKCKHCGEFLDHRRATESDKRILSLFLLWLVFGPLGVHAFYAGRRWQGFFFLFALFVAYYLWVQGIFPATRRCRGQPARAANDQGSRL